MKNSMGWMIPTALAALAALAVIDWIQRYHAYTVTPRIAGMDNRPHVASAPEEPFDLTGTLQTFDGTPSTIIASWPGFRGPNRNGILDDASVTLADHWPAEGLPSIF